MNYVKKVLFASALAWSFFITTQMNAEEKPDEKERKKVHIYVSPYSVRRYTDLAIRRRQEDEINFSILYGFTNKFYLGLTYNRGEGPISRNHFIPSYYSGFSQAREYNRTRVGEYFMIRSQYFFYGNFYGSFNVGLEKGFTIQEKNFLYIRGSYAEFHPYSKTTTHSDRYFASLGLGYRKEFFEYFLIGTEFEAIGINSGKFREHYTFDPTYYNGGLPANYRFDKAYFQFQEKKNSGFFYVSIYAGIAL